MNFDKSKVFTALNADEVKVGSRGYFANNLDTLKRLVNINALTDVLNKVYPEDWGRRFGKKDCNFIFILFYLVEEPAEEKYRPYKNTDELIEDFKERIKGYGVTSSKCPMFQQTIWIKRKDELKKHLIISFYEDCIYIEDVCKDMKDLFENYTYLDGTPCGKKNDRI